MGRPSRDEGRWLWVPPTAIVVGFLVFGISQLVPGEDGHPNRQERLLQRADALCRAHQPGGQDPVMSGATTAGEVVRTARFVGESDPAPWNRLPGDHFVAQCSYVSLTFDPGATRECPNGELYSLSKPTQMLVDDDGRTSSDYTARSLPAIPPC